MKKVYLVLASIFLLAIVAGFFGFQNVVSFSGALFEKALTKQEAPQLTFRDLKIDKMTIDGNEKTFSLNDGRVYADGKLLDEKKDSQQIFRVMKLALFFQQSKESPLLFDPALDVESFNAALQRMREQNDIWDLETGTGYVNPVSFLQSFSDVSSEYLKFQQDVSEKSARDMLSSMKKTQGEYVKDANRIGKIFDDATSNGSDGGTMMFLGGDTSSNLRIMADDFEKIRQNGEFLVEEIEKRENCLEKMECERPLLSTEKPILKENEQTADLKILSREDMTLRGEEFESGPLLVHSSCWKGRDRSLMFAAKMCGGIYERCLDWPLLSDGEYYAKTEDRDSKEKVLRDNGIDRRIQSASAPYGCMDLTFKPKLREMNFALVNYKKNRLFAGEMPSTQSVISQKNMETVWSEGRQFEDAFFDAAYPSDFALENLAGYYSYTYGFLANENILNSSVGDEFLERTNILRGKLQDFALIMDRSTFHLRQYLEHNLSKEANKKNPEYIFAIRSNYSITFLNFSPFVWRIDESPQYFISKNDRTDVTNKTRGEDTPMLSYAEAVELYGKEELTEWINFAKDKTSF